MSLVTVNSVAALREQVKQWRASGLTVGFVPTMGNLHDGHYSLVTEAKRHADKIVASIFVNPLQFGKNEDLDAYPRTLAADQQGLAASGCDLLFAPTVAEMYPKGLAEQTIVEVPQLGERWCGASRPGHFRGVATVVCKLFNMVQPDVACFGEKDFQQLAVIRAMVTDLALPVKVVGVATKREDSGLAMSSRNGYLTVQEKAQAAFIYQQLQLVKTAISEGQRDYAALSEQAQQRLAAAGFRRDYFAICDAHNLQLADNTSKDLVVLVAAGIGKARLIDNIAFSL